MKKNCSAAPLAILLSICCHVACGQIIKVDSLTYWKKTFKAGVNINQAAFSKNWKAGGVNSFGFNTFLNAKADFKKEKNSWDNEVDLLYGMVSNKGQGYRKTLDRIFLDTRYGRAMNKNWNLGASINLQSQFAKGYQYEQVNDIEVSTFISDIFAPAFITGAFGFEYHPVDYFKVRLSPLAPRVTIVNGVERFVTTDNPTPYGVVPPGSTRFEWLAAQVLAEFNKDIAKNVNLKARYVLFANYETLDLKRVDHRLDVNFVAKISRFVNVSLGGILIYDFDQDTGAQYSQAFSLGVLYTFQNFQEKKEK